MSAIYDPALSNCTPVTLSAAGQMDSQLSADSDVRISCRALADQQGVDNFCLVCEEESFARRIKALDFSGAKLTDAQVAQLISDGVARCSNIIELNLSYIPLSHKAVAALCTMINVKISGYCSLQRLYLPRTSLDFKNCKAVLSACLSNIVLQQLVLSGNRYMRLTSESIVAVLADPENRFVSLNMGNCALDCGVLQACCPTLGRHPFLRELQLNSNDFGDDGGEILFSNLVKGNCSVLENINLDRCKFESCRWAVHLPQLACLHALSVSYNCISDAGLQELCRHVERCFSIRSLSLASNAFGERAICLGSLLQCNPGLIHLDLSGNQMYAEAAESIAFGILNNKTMLRLNMSNCVISTENVLKLCKSLLSNSLIEIDLSQNPVEKAIQVSAREYTMANQHLFEADSLCPVETGNYSRLSFDALERAEIWREEQRKIFAEVKLAAEIVAEVTGADVSSPKADDDSPPLADMGLLEESKEQSSLARPGTAVEVGENFLGGDMGTTLARSSSAVGSLNTARADTALDRSSSAGVNSQSKGARRRKNIKEEEGTVITVSYGPRSVVLGTIRVPTSASYANVRLLIQPLVAEYFERLNQSADEVPGDSVFRDTAGDRTDAFRMVDPNNVVVDREAEGSRILLSELFGSEFPTSIVVRPTTWLQLPDDHEDGNDC